ncbi:MAG: hypothetical protein J5525_12675 [Lachnospiraceae bacterium]|nr:hypothetical protein [Lachnospiraceae bacterium]
MRKRRVRTLIGVLITTILLGSTQIASFASEKTTASGEEVTTKAAAELDEFSGEETEEEKVSDDNAYDESLYIGALEETHMGEDSKEGNVYIFNDSEVFINLYKDIVALDQGLDADVENNDILTFKEAYVPNGVATLSPVTISKADYAQLINRINEEKDSMMTKDEFATYFEPYYKAALEKQAELEAAENKEQDEINSLFEGSGRLKEDVFDTTRPYMGQKANDTIWDVKQLGSRKTSFTLNIEANNPVKLEVFYTAGKNAPQVSLVSPNKRIYSNKGNEEGTELKVINRKNLEVKDFPDLRYDIIYIYTTSEKYAGKWQIAYSIDNDVYETILVNAAADSGWENFVEEYKTPVKFFILWYFDNEKSHYTATNLVPIVQAESQPVANNLQAAKPDEVEKKNLDTPVIIGIMFLIIAAFGLCIYLFFKINEDKQKQGKYRIEKANKKIRARRKKENNQLDKYLTKYDDDYSDDEYYENENKQEEEEEISYFKDNQETDDEDIPQRQFVHMDDNGYPKENIDTDNQVKQPAPKKPAATKPVQNANNNAANNKPVNKNKTVANKPNNAPKNPQINSIKTETPVAPAANAVQPTVSVMTQEPIIQQQTPVMPQAPVITPAPVMTNQPQMQNQPNGIFIPLQGAVLVGGQVAPQPIPQNQPVQETPQIPTVEIPEGEKIPTWHKAGEHKLDENAPSWKRKAPISDNASFV